MRWTPYDADAEGCLSMSMRVKRNLVVTDAVSPHTVLALFAGYLNHHTTEEFCRKDAIAFHSS